MHAPFAAPKRSHPVLKLGAFMITLASIASTLATMSPLALAPLAALVVVLVTYYLRKCRYTRVRPFSRLALLVVALGLCTFIPYGVGLVLGLFRYTLIKAGIYTKPI